MEKNAISYFFMAATLFLGGCQDIYFPPRFSKTLFPHFLTSKEKKTALNVEDKRAPGAFSPSCKPGELSVSEENILSMGIRMESDGKWCALDIGHDENGAYQSSGVSISPEHGRAYIYTGEEGTTYVAYRAELGYQGEDHFRIFLIPDEDRPRKTMDINLALTAPEHLSAASLREAEEEDLS